MGVAAAGLALGLAGAVTGAYANYAASRLRARQADYNRRMGLIGAADALARGNVLEGQVRRNVSALIGAQRAAVGSSGIVADIGSAARIQSDAMVFGELDALTVRNNAAREAWGLRQQARGYGFEKALARVGASWGSVATLLGGTASALGGYSGARKG